jgi:putative transposase
MRELNFSEQNVAEAFEEIKPNFEEEVEEQMGAWNVEGLNAVLRVEANTQVGAGLYERTLRRVDYWAGYRPRTVITTKGTFELRVPRARSVSLQFTVFDRYQRLWKRVDKILREMFLAGCSTRRTGEMLGLLLGTKVSAQTVSRAIKELTPLVESFHHRELTDHYRILLFDGVSQRIRSASGTVTKKIVLVAYGIRHDGCRELIDFRVSPSESENAWYGFLNSLYHRGLEGNGLELIASDGCKGFIAALAHIYPDVKHQLCWVHKLRNVAEKVNKRDENLVLAGARKIYRAPHRKAAQGAFKRWKNQWGNQYPGAIKCVEVDLDNLLTCFDFPKKMRKHIRTTNLIERSFREVRKRTRPISCFGNAQSCERVIYAVIVYENSKLEGKPFMKSAHNS